jgi:hypothetical protein
MKLSDVLVAVKGGNFTCSTGAQLLAEQPTTDEVSHAHIHALDPFQVDTTKIKPSAFQAPSTVPVSALIDGRKKFWENPELHLHPLDAHPHQAQVYNPSAPPKFEPYEFYLDQSKLATNDTYLKRGMDTIPENTVTTYSQTVVYQESGKPKPTSGSFSLASKTDSPVLPTGAVLKKALDVKETVTKIHPTYMKMEAHSMFEDSEVLVMATTAVILSDAGLLALGELDGRAEGSYIAVFSATAVKAVDVAFVKNHATVPLQMVERSPGSTTVNTTGKQPKLETSGAVYKKVSMVRTVLVVKKDKGDLIIVTCYPSQSHPVLPPPNPPPTATDDVVELDKSAALFRVIKQSKSIELKW